MLGDGSRFGTFCAVDSQPMHVAADQIEAMTSLALLVSYAIDVERLATHDPLTGLYNTSLFDDHLTIELARARRNGTMLAVLSIDLDEFKRLTDLHGHQTGKRVLACVGARLRSTIRHGDTAARLRNDEFALILPDIPKMDSAQRVAQTVLESLQDPIEVGDDVFTLSVCIGVAVYPAHGLDGKRLMEWARAAMRIAKAEGGDRLQMSTQAKDAEPEDDGEPPASLRAIPPSGE